MATIKKINYHLHSLRSIRKQIPAKVAAIIASAYILPHIDYCNSLLIDIPYSHIKPIHIIQNSIVRCIFNINRFSRDHISLYVKSLHWLPIEQRIKYKALMIMHNAIHNDYPDYIASLITIR